MNKYDDMPLYETFASLPLPVMVCLWLTHKHTGTGVARTIHNLPDYLRHNISWLGMYLDTRHPNSVLGRIAVKFLRDYFAKELAAIDKLEQHNIDFMIFFKEEKK